MHPTRRQLLLASLALPMAGCAIRPLSPVAARSLPVPASMPAIRPPALGQKWTYRKSNFFNSQLLATETEEVTSVGNPVVVSRRNDAGQVLPEERDVLWGQVQQDPVWDFVHSYERPVAHWPASLATGAVVRDRLRYQVSQFSYPFWMDYETRVKGWEQVQVAAGTFDAVKIEKYIRLEHYHDLRVENVRHDTIWLAPSIGRWVLRETSGTFKVVGTEPFPGNDDGFRWELTGWA